MRGQLKNNRQGIKWCVYCQKSTAWLGYRASSSALGLTGKIMANSAKTCFIIMPFSDMDGYEAGHFGRVYEHLIRPACVAAGVEPVRGDEVKSTNYIAIDILQRILRSDIVICDLSGKNANVMYELGMRQAFDLPAVLLKDKRTERVFDIQGLRTIDYTETLRVDTVEQDRKALTQTISATLKLESHEVNSLVSLLGIEKASLGKTTHVSAETALVLASLKDISTRLAAVEESSLSHKNATIQSRPRTLRQIDSGSKIHLNSGATLTAGDDVYDISSDRYDLLGTLTSWSNSGLVVTPEKGEPFLIPLNDPRISNLSSIPF